MRKLHIFLLVALVLIAGCTQLTPLDDSDINSSDKNQEEISFDQTEKNHASVTLEYKKISSESIGNLAGPFDFLATIPKGWQVEAVPTIEAINIFDPDVPGENNLEKSQIFIRYFNANQFLTLSTVTIFNQTATTTNNRPTVIYDIEKKPGVANFSSQPLWRSERHEVTDIRSTNSNPAVFYVLGRHPELKQEIWDGFLYGLEFNSSNSELLAPVSEFESEFEERITKKPFGILIDPATSPVQPERFSGYHNAVDVEYEDVLSDVPVFAIANGTIVRSGTVAGYGGMLAIQHQINNKNLLAIYGHLDPKSLVANGTVVTAGEQIGILGDSNSSETDGERKHLHFGIYTGTDINISGYVQTKQELSNWIDPLSLY